MKNDVNLIENFNKAKTMFAFGRIPESEEEKEIFVLIMKYYPEASCNYLRERNMLLKLEEELFFLEEVWPYITEAEKVEYFEKKIEEWKKEKILTLWNKLPKDNKELVKKFLKKVTEDDFDILKNRIKDEFEMPECDWIGLALLDNKELMNLWTINDYYYDKWGKPVKYFGEMLFKSSYAKDLVRQNWEIPDYVYSNFEYISNLGEEMGEIFQSADSIQKENILLTIYCHVMEIDDISYYQLEERMTKKQSQEFYELLKSFKILEKIDLDSKTGEIFEQNISIHLTKKEKERYEEVLKSQEIMKIHIASSYRRFNSFSWSNYENGKLELEKLKEFEKILLLQKYSADFGYKKASLIDRNMLVDEILKLIKEANENEANSTEDAANNTFFRRAKAEIEEMIKTKDKELNKWIKEKWITKDAYLNDSVFFICKIIGSEYGKLRNFDSEEMKEILMFFARRKEEYEKEDKVFIKKIVEQMMFSDIFDALHGYYNTSFFKALVFLYSKAGKVTDEDFTRLLDNCSFDIVGSLTYEYRIKIPEQVWNSKVKENIKYLFLMPDEFAANILSSKDA